MWRLVCCYISPPLLCYTFSITLRNPHNISQCSAISQRIRELSVCVFVCVCVCVCVCVWWWGRGGGVWSARERERETGENRNELEIESKKVVRERVWEGKGEEKKEIIEFLKCPFIDPLAQRYSCISMHQNVELHQPSSPLIYRREDKNIKCREIKTKRGTEGENDIRSRRGGAEI